MLGCPFLGLDRVFLLRDLLRLLPPKSNVNWTSPLEDYLSGEAQFGLRVLFRNFNIKVFEKLDTPGRNLFPLHYALLAYKDSTKSINSREMKFEYRSGPVCLNSDLSILSGISADSYAASLTVGSITA